MLEPKMRSKLKNFNPERYKMKVFCRKTGLNIQKSFNIDPIVISIKATKSISSEKDIEILMRLAIRELFKKICGAKKNENETSWKMRHFHNKHTCSRPTNTRAKIAAVRIINRAVKRL